MAQSSTSSSSWTLAKVQEEIARHPLVILIGAASWKASSLQLIQEIEQLSLNVPLIPLLVDAEEDGEDGEGYQELALSLEIKDIPTILIYRNGLLLKKLIGAEATLKGLQSVLANPNPVKTPSCCAPSSSCCAPSSNCAPTSSDCCAPSSSCCAPSSCGSNNNDEDIRKMISSQYAATLRGGASCCVSIDSTLNGYSADDIETVGSANLGLGCGNPLLLANIQEGETVVDLGSGAGIDCFLASKSVGSTGQVIGIDMTPDMVYQARQNIKQFHVTNVSFRLGEIEYLPIRDCSVDVVISNCVINLSPDKQQVFHEIFRILKSNGRVAISDVINRDNPLPESLKTAEALAC
jgi:2-polyprenyl-3-methyl-5-hydroxy-6-metoxy-1,4-benzoquinol methylase